MLAQIDIEDLVQRCRSLNARAYVKEAVDCYRIGAYRACVITTWIAVVYDFIDKFRELAVAGDASAAKQVALFDEIQKKRDTEGALKFERDVLALAKDNFELITIQEKTELDRLFEDRNRCGHPNLNREEEVYSPPPELARLHLRVAIEHVLGRPPVQGKAALGMLKQTVDSEYFPIETKDAEKVLSSTPLPRAKRNVIRDFVLGGFISLMREDLPERKMLQRIAALRAALIFQPETAKQVLHEKFDEGVFKTLDNSLSRVIWLLASEPDLQSFLKDPTWVKLENYVRAMPSQEITTVVNALQIGRLHSHAIERLKMAKVTEMADAVASLQARPDDFLIARCLELYEKANSYDEANAMAKKIILPLLPRLNSLEASRIIMAGQNSQVRESNQFTSVAWEIKEAKKLSDQEMSDAIDAAGLQRKLGHLTPMSSSAESSS